MSQRLHHRPRSGIRRLALLTSLTVLSSTLYPAHVIAYTHPTTQTFQYDALNRLTQAIGSYGTSTYAYDPLGNMTRKEGVTMTYGEGPAGPHAVTSVQGSGVEVQGGLTLAYDANGNLLEKRPSTLNLEPTTQSFAYDAENRLTEVTTAPEETVTLRFEPGWNFFSLPVIPDDPRVTAVFPTYGTDIDTLARYDPTANDPFTGHFQHYVGTNPKFDDFTTLEYGRGYQLYCTNPSGVTVTLKGKLPTKPITKALSVGWHLLPAITTEGPKPLSWLLSGVTYDQVYGYNAATQQLEVATEVTPHHAYYVNVAAGSWTPPLPRDVTTRFVYDGDGGRVKQLTATGTTTFLGPSYEIAPDGTTTTYVFAGSQRIAAIDTPPGSVALNRAPPTSRLARWLRDALTHLAALVLGPSAEAAVLASHIRFYHTDHLGSSNVVTDGAGQVVELAEHTPYGSLSRREGAANVAQKFTGQRQDDRTGLILFPARLYDPALGRFLQPDPFVQDPADPQTLNRYSYVRNNPVNFVDPSGYFSVKEFWKGVVLAVVAVIALVVAVGAALTGNEPLAVAAFMFAVAAAVGSYQSFSAAFRDSSSPRGPPNRAAESPTGQSAQAWEGPSLVGQAADAALTPIYNTLTEPGLNYGRYLSNLDAGKGVFNENLYGAMLDSLLVISSLSTALEQVTTYGVIRNSSQNVESASKIIQRQTTVIGSRVDTLAYKGRPGYNVLDIPNWSLRKNIKWLDSAMRRGDVIKLVTDPSKWKDVNPKSAFFQELRYLAWKLRGTIDYGQ